MLRPWGGSWAVTTTSAKAAEGGVLACAVLEKIPARLAENTKSVIQPVWRQRSYRLPHIENTFLEININPTSFRVNPEISSGVVCRMPVEKASDC